MARRIAIIGGGIGGLAAAHFLRRAGERNITIFEREERMGGKCHSRPLNGAVFDLGATVIAPGFTEAPRLLREYGLETDRITSRGPCGLFDAASGEPRTFSWRERARLTWQLGRFFQCRRRAADFSRPGFGHLGEALAEPFAAWLRRHGLDELQEVFAPFLTGYGYGYADEVPAAYALVYFAPQWTLPTLFGGTNRIVLAGYQALVERMAERFDVRRGAAVRAIKPGPQPGVITDGAVERFDRVVLAAGRPPRGFFATVDAELEELFSEVRGYTLHVAMAETSGLPASAIFLPAHFRPGAEGRLVCGFQQWPRRSTVTMLLCFAGSGADANLEAAMRADAEKLGGRPGAILARRRWDYFPHVGPEAFARGFYRRLEAAQGRNGIYFAGELLSFPTVEHVVRYSRWLVRTHF